MKTCEWAVEPGTFVLSGPWRACGKPRAPGRYVCAEHALEQDADVKRYRDAQEADAKDLLYSLGAP